MNPEIQNINQIRIGQVIKISSNTSSNTNQGSNSSTGSTSASKNTYIVKSGDTFSGIAQKHNLRLSELVKLNPQIVNINKLRVGEVVYLTSKVSQSGDSGSNSSNPNNTTNQKNTYTIKSGDTFSAVAKKFNMSVSALLDLNPQIKNPNFIKVGQVVYVSGKTSSGSSSNGSNATVSWEQKANSVIATGKKYLGAKYLYGASINQTNAFDCSSFTKRVFQENGINLPRTSIEQAQIGTPIAITNIRKGDLIFFDTNYDKVINHVAIVIDESTIIHCATSTGVTISNLNTYWKPRVAKVRRVL